MEDEQSRKSTSLETNLWAMKILFKRLNRRSQRKSYTWMGFNELLKYFRIEKPRITEKKLPKQLKMVFMRSEA